jgi:hypothetical protein
VLLGAVLTVAREWWFQRRREKKDAEFLAVQVLGQLDRYVAGCANVVFDDGLSEGQRDENGYRRTQVSPPKFEPETLKVEWKALPLKLMYEILDLPYRAEVASHSVSAAFEYAATPPDFEEGFDERQFQYALLGLDAARLAAQLRVHAGLPTRSGSNWDPVANMEERKAKIEQERRVAIDQHKLSQLPSYAHESGDA